MSTENGYEGMLREFKRLKIPPRQVAENTNKRIEHFHSQMNNPIHLEYFVSFINKSLKNGGKIDYDVAIKEFFPR